MVTMTAATSWVAKGSVTPKENVEEGADGEGEDAPAADAEGELADFEKGARLEAAVGHAVDAAEGEGEHHRHGEERVDLDVGHELAGRIDRHRGETREEDEGERQRDAGAEEVAADLHPRQLAVGDGAVGRCKPSPTKVIPARVGAGVMRGGDTQRVDCPRVRHRGPGHLDL